MPRRLSALCTAAALAVGAELVRGWLVPPTGATTYGTAVVGAIPHHAGVPAVARMVEPEKTAGGSGPPWGGNGVIVVGPIPRDDGDREVAIRTVAGGPLPEPTPAVPPLGRKLDLRLPLSPSSDPATPEPEEALPPRPGEFGASFAFDSRTTVGDDMADRVGASLQREGNWRRSAVWRAALAHAESLRLDFDGAFNDTRRPADEDDASFALGPVLGWEANTVGEAKATVALFDGRVKLTTHHALSRYTPPPPGFHSSGKKKKEWKEDRERFAGVEVAQGRAELHRLDLTLWQRGARHVSAFGQYSSVDRLFEDLELVGDEHPFAEPNRSAIEVGGTIGAGPMSLKLWYSRERNNIDEQARRPMTVERRGHWHAALALDDPALLGPAAARGGVARLLPDALWFAGDRGRVERVDGEPGPSDRASSLGVGASWLRDALYASVELRQSRLDSRRATDADTEERTISLGLGYYGERWGIDAGLDLERYAYTESAGTATERGHGPWIATSLRLDHLPDLTGKLSFYRYKADHVPDGTTSRYDSWELETALDFSKFLAEKVEEGSPRLVARYLLEGSDGRDDYSGSTGRLDHALLISASYPLP